VRALPGNLPQGNSDLFQLRWLRWAANLTDGIGIRCIRFLDGTCLPAWTVEMVGLDNFQVAFNAIVGDVYEIAFRLAVSYRPSPSGSIRRVTAVVRFDSS
jgi:hypothetical protein